MIDFIIDFVDTVKSNPSIFILIVGTTGLLISIFKLIPGRPLLKIKSYTEYLGLNAINFLGNDNIEDKTINDNTNASRELITKVHISVRNASKKRAFNVRIKNLENNLRIVKNLPKDCTIQHDDDAILELEHVMTVFGKFKDLKNPKFFETLDITKDFIKGNPIFEIFYENSKGKDYLTQFVISKNRIFKEKFFVSSFKFTAISVILFFIGILFVFNILNLEIKQDPIKDASENVVSKKIDSNIVKPSLLAANSIKWSKENLKIDTQNAVCYDTEREYCILYGKLYSWKEAQKACNSLGQLWRLPTAEEWIDLIKEYSEMGVFAGEKAFQSLTKGGESGINITLGGFYTGQYRHREEIGFYWSSTQEEKVFARAFGFDKNKRDINLYRLKKTVKASCRCIKEF